MSSTQKAPPKPNGAALQRTPSYQWPSGHIGHLSEGQTDQLTKFKSLCQQKGYYHPGDDKTPPSHDDETLLRYLRARKFIPQDAFVQFKDTEDWRQENKLDALYQTIDVEEYEQTRRLYPQWTGRRDKRGIPFYVFEVAHLDAKEVTAYQNDSDRKKNKAEKGQAGKEKVPRKMMRLFALYENLCRFVLPLCSAIPNRPNAETPVSQSSNIVDISKVGFKQFWNLRAHLQDSSALATAHYPETLDHIFIIGAPSFFPTVWEWAKRWFDPITVSKMSILNSSNTLEILTKFVDIENIPKKYGGKLDWSFGDMPHLDSEIANSLRWKEDIRENGHRSLPTGPIKWEYDEHGDLVALGVGTENGVQRKKVLAGLHPEAGIARLALSPGRNERSALFATASQTGALTAQKSQNSAQAAAAAGPETSSLPQAHTSLPAQTNGSARKMATPPPPSSPNSDLAGDQTSSSAAQESNLGGTYTVPYRDHQIEVSAPPIDARQGTSATRFEQQADTHAEGQVEHGTPETRKDGQGSEHAVMEPRTVGQAPKDTPLYRDEGEQPTLIEQAQGIAGSVYTQAAALPATVMSAVGMSAKPEEAKDEAKVEDPRVDQMENKHVEEFLRDKTQTSVGAQSSKS